MPRGTDRDGGAARLTKRLENERRKLAKYPLAMFRIDMGINQHQMAERLNSSTGMIHKLDLGNVPPNHPFLERYAEGYGIGVEKMRGLMKSKPMSDFQVNRLMVMQANGSRPGVPRGYSHAANGNGNGGGNGHAHGKRIILKKVPLEIREQIRMVVSTVNLNAIKGLRETTLPTQALVYLIREFGNSIGLEAEIVVDAVFERVFG